jgi:hypothetical protein
MDSGSDIRIFCIHCRRLPVSAAPDRPAALGEIIAFT